MQKIAEVLLRNFLRRYPVPTRLNLVGYLGRYSWLKGVLDELRPELFPPKPEPEAAESLEAAPPKPDDTILSILDGSEIQGRLGYYKAEAYLRPRGNGYLFTAIETASKRPVVIKEFLLPPTSFTKTEALQRQSGFQRLAGIQLADGRLQDFRVIQPIEAIADTASYERCYLVTDARDQAPTLGQRLETRGPFPPPQVQEILSQILQTLDFLHRQKFIFPCGTIQNGLVHGNLSLDTILWVDQKSQPFVYLCDLLLWEQYFDSSGLQGRSIQATRDTIQQDLRATANLAMALLQGGTDQVPLAIDPQFRQFLDSLRSGKYPSAEAARQDLLLLMAQAPIGLVPWDSLASQPPPPRKVTPLLLLALLGLAAGAMLLLPRLKPTAARSAPQVPKIATCCLSEVSAIPPGSFTFTAIQDGTWWKVWQQQNLLQRGQSLESALVMAQPNLQLRYQPADSLEEVLQQVRSGAANFAVMPLVDELPSDLLAQEIAYDGLVTVVSFSYAERQQGLPTALQGRLKLSQVQQLYNGQVNQWTAVGGPALLVRRYASSNPETLAIFQQRVLKSRELQSLPEIQKLPPIDLFRRIIRDFEDQQIGSIGFTSISEVWGQCSVYPLAIGQVGQAAVQPIVLNNGREIDPETDLCDRKGSYFPAPDKFQSGDYPLSYPIVVVYPRDNRRSALGKKFVELMRTVEGQRLLQASGLVPLSQNLPKQPLPSPAAKR